MKERNGYARTLIVDFPCSHTSGGGGGEGILIYRRKYYYGRIIINFSVGRGVGVVELLGGGATL